MRAPLPGMVALAAALLLSSFAPSAPADAPAPCRDPRGCPDMTIDLSQLVVVDRTHSDIPPGSCIIQEGYVPGPGFYTFVRLNLGAPNVGKGDLVLGKPSENPALFFWSVCHGHYHLRDYITTRIWTLDGWQAWDHARRAHPEWNATQTFAAYPQLLDATTRAAKVSFCAVDIYPQPANQGGAAVPDPLPKYTDCSDQGVSVGWSDLYIYSQVGNWADATGLKSGLYMLEAEVNTYRAFVESDYTNNRGAVPVLISSKLPP